MTILLNLVLTIFYGLGFFVTIKAVSGYTGLSFDETGVHILLGLVAVLFANMAQGRKQ